MPSLRNSSSSSSVNGFFCRGSRFISSEFYTLIRGTKFKLVLAQRRVADFSPLT